MRQIFIYDPASERLVGWGHRFKVETEEEIVPEKVIVGWARRVVEEYTGSPYRAFMLISKDVCGKIRWHNQFGYPCEPEFDASSLFV